LPGFSPVSGKYVVAKFDGGLLSSDGGVPVLSEVEQRIRVAGQMSLIDSHSFARWNSQAPLKSGELNSVSSDTWETRPERRRAIDAIAAREEFENGRRRTASRPNDFRPP
jgi:hypothetical protein